MTDLKNFVKLAVALKPWQDQLVFIGGWAHRLLRWHPLAAIPEYKPIATRDADVAFDDQVRLEGSIKDTLLAAGFKEELSSEHRPPVSHYTLGDEDLGFYAEFLTPLTGSGTKRSGEPDATLSKAGISAQKLRHLEVLLLGPWQVSLGTDIENITTALSLWLPNPTSFIVQKLLIRHDRKPAKRAQDVLYIHDTLELFGENLETLANIWTAQITSSLTKKQRTDVLASTAEMFTSVSDTVRTAAKIPQDRELDPERIRALCQYAMEEILN